MDNNEFKWKHFAPEIILWGFRASSPLSELVASSVIQAEMRAA
ncbi:hypothetical protein SAMN02745132_04871 [Enterovibrio nigricans DSM 22720]|uniref:Uncharacterized protein n=1 Tax=Enterovibrio nigricans DSM 22720 TaxID=1121868 RepID=A0A1T4WD88_9GAMM|nr:hypothetical protein SAMN02745132_04871 [Enterovibrio nigricans DSM 22720]